MKPLTPAEVLIVTEITERGEVVSLFQLSLALNIDYKWAHRCVRRLHERRCIEMDRLSHGKRALVMKSKCWRNCKACKCSRGGTRTQGLDQ